MPDIPNDTGETNYRKTNNERVQNVRGIQGLDEHIDKSKAHGENELAKDLKKFDERLKPAYYKGDGLHAETQAQIEKVNLRADHHATSALEKIQQRDNGWEQPIKTMQDHQAKPFFTLDTMEGFKKPPKVKVHEREEIYNRYIGPGQERTGRWMTKDNYNTPSERKEKLSLSDENTARENIQLRIDKGAPYLEGEASPRYGHGGGGHQIYVIDKNSIHEVNE